MPGTVLIISPHFPPINGADGHRVRMVLPFIEKHGWQCEVLTVTPDSVQMPIDEWLEKGIPSEIHRHRVKALGPEWSRVPGLGTLDFRAQRVMRQAGDRLLSSGRFDLVYFSTTSFGLHVLGPVWQRKHGVPFIMDYQDPWVTDYFKDHPEVVPPGGRLKYSVVDRINRWREPRVLRYCSGITSVSESYPRQLNERYGFTENIPAFVIPFPGAPRDLERVAADGITQDCFDPNDGKQHWVYVGVSGAIMKRSLTSLFLAIRNHAEENPGFLKSIQLHFIGTSYAPAGTAQPVVIPIARRFALESVVWERTDRVRYSTALRCLMDADALLVPGSDESGYNASKLFPYLLTRKPMLVVFHRDSPVCRLISSVAGATLVAFTPEQTDREIAEHIQRGWLSEGTYREIIPLNNEEMKPYTDDGQSQVLCRFFDKVMEHRGVES
jgi:glycosyltransferase involved in cell wall biosynthesis